MILNSKQKKNEEVIKENAILKEKNKILSKEKKELIFLLNSTIKQVKKIRANLQIAEDICNENEKIYQELLMLYKASLSEKKQD